MSRNACKLARIFGLIVCGVLATACDRGSPAPGAGEAGAPGAESAGSGGSERTGANAGGSAGSGNPASGGEAAGAPFVASSAAFERVIDAKGATRVYRMNLDDLPPGLEWSEDTVSRTVKGDRPYIGNILPGQPLSLTLTELPRHKLIRFTCDLFLLRSWDGSSPIWGFNRWDLDLTDGRSLIHTTFGTAGFFSDNNEQAFPDSWPARPHPAWTGASEHETLGFMQFQNRFDSSSVTHLVLTFPHTEKDIGFSFYSTIEQDQRKYFGLTNVVVEVLPELQKHTDAEFAALWKDLAHPHYTKFYTAQWELISCADAAVAYIGQHLDDSADLSAKDIMALVEKLSTLDGESFKETLDQVIMQGRLANEPIEAALQRADLSQHAHAALERAERLLKRYPETATDARRYRAKRLLIAIHSPAAVALAAKLPDLPEPPATK